MDNSEFAIIRQYFAPLSAGWLGAEGLRNDGATLPPFPAGEAVAVTTDTLVAGVHFLGHEPADLIAQKALRVNLSDLAAMQARPLAYTLNLALPGHLGMDGGWLQAFCGGLAQEQRDHPIPLIGGDTVATPGPLTLTITAFGTVPGKPLLRSGAEPGDGLYVTGHLGAGRAGLALLQRDPAATGPVVQRYLLPEPRVELALALRGLVSAGLDISDGLAGDLPHLCKASGIGAKVNVDALPRLAGVTVHDAVAGGDDYELLLAVPAVHADKAAAIARGLNVPLTRIGYCDWEPGTIWHTGDGQRWLEPVQGFQHF